MFPAFCIILFFILLCTFVIMVPYPVFVNFWLDKFQHVSGIVETPLAEFISWFLPLFLFFYILYDFRR